MRTLGAGRRVGLISPNNLPISYVGKPFIEATEGEGEKWEIGNGE